MDQFREGKRGFQARTDFGMPMYSSGRRTAGISRGGSLGLVLALAVEVDAVADELGVAGVADVGGFAGSGVELMMECAA